MNETEIPASDTFEKMIRGFAEKTNTDTASETLLFETDKAIIEDNVRLLSEATAVDLPGVSMSREVPGIYIGVTQFLDEFTIVTALRITYETATGRIASVPLDAQDGQFSMFRTQMLTRDTHHEIRVQRPHSSFSPNDLRAIFQPENITAKGDGVVVSAEIQRESSWIMPERVNRRENEEYDEPTMIRKGISKLTPGDRVFIESIDSFTFSIPIGQHLFDRHKLFPKKEQ